MSAAMARHGGRAGWGAASGAALALVLAACGGTRRETRGAAGPAPAPASGGQAAATAKGPAIPSAAAPAAQAEPEATPDAPFRQTKPEPLASQSPFEAPAPAQRRLRNGARLLVVENHNVPLVAVTVLVAAGSNADPLDRAGLADFVANMLDEGTKSRTAPELAEAIENLAARLTANAGAEYTRVSLNSLTETLPQALELLADVLVNPAFRPADIERVRGLMLTELLQKAANPSLVARDEMGRRLWGAKHPWGQPAGGTPESLASIGQAELRKFHHTWFRPNNAIVAVAGDVSPDEAQKLLDARLARWRARPVPRLKLPAPPDLTARSITLVDKPATSQSQVWVAGRLFEARNPDAVPMRVANYILGGLFGSRLNMNLRENKGYSYGVRSQVSLMRDTGILLASGGIVAKNTPEALVEYEKELRAFSNGEVSDEELARAKEAYVRSLPSALETNDAVALSVAVLAFNGLPLDYFRTLPARIARVSKADVARVAQRWIKPDAWPVVIVGPKAMSEEKLKAMDLGPVDVRAPADRSLPAAKAPGIRSAR
jgi:zinc protease